MPRNKILAVASMAVAAVAVVGLTACGSSHSKSLAEQVCDKANTCNYLSGVSVAECVSALNLCLNGLTAQNRADFENLSRTALTYQACANWAAAQPIITSCWP